MSLKYRAHNAKKDANHSEIVDALRRIGCTVRDLNDKGLPDLLVGIRGVNILLEIKDGSKPPSARKLTADQEKFFAEWKGQRAVVNSVDAALEVVGMI